jgi:hypothetical protein
MFVAAPAYAAPPGVTTIYAFETPGADTGHAWIACTVKAYEAEVSSISGAVKGTGKLDCVYDDGSVAVLPYMSLTETLANPSLNVQVQDHEGEPDTAGLLNIALSSPCGHGAWSSVANGIVNWPAGYDFSDTHVDDAAYTTLNPGDCPQDVTHVPNLFADDSDEARLALQSAGLRLGTVGCCVNVVEEYLDGEVVVQSIAAGAAVRYGTVVDVTTGFFNPYPCGEFAC